jgi:hypothetical protein
LIEPTPEELAKLVKNDRYQISSLKVTATAHLASVLFDPAIKVMDVAKGSSSFIDVIQSELKNKKDELELIRKAKLTIREVVGSAFKNVSATSRGWTVWKVDQTTYALSGPGLGWQGGKIADGQWTYQVDKKALIPVDSTAITLRNILSANY